MHTSIFLWVEAETASDDGTLKLHLLHVSPFNFAIATPSFELTNLENFALFVGERFSISSENLFL